MPAPRSTRPGPDDRSTVLDTQVIAQARRTAARPGTAPHPARPYPSYPPRPYPSYPAWPAPTGPVPPGGDPTARSGAPETAVAGTGEDEPPKLTLSATQVVASMSAAVVAAFLGAQLGVAGTVIGAAIASVVSVVGSAVIGHSLLVTRRKVALTVQHVRAPDPADTVLLTAVAPEPTRLTRPSPAASPAPVPKERRPARPGRLRWVLVGLATSVLVFAGALGAVTVVEAVTGAPISGGSSGGLSVLGGTPAGGGSDSDPTGPTDPTDPTGAATVTTEATSPATVTETSAPGGPSAPSSTGASTGSSAPATSSPSTPSTATPNPGAGAATTAASPTVAAATPTG